MDRLTRRDWLRAAGVAAGGLALPGVGCALGAGTAGQVGVPIADDGSYLLPPLPYAYDALEPHIDEATLRTHHDKHHAGYVKGLNAALAALAEARAKGDASAVPGLVKKIAFHGSGHVLHSLYWLNLSPKGGGEPTGDLAAAIRREFGSYAAFKKELVAATNAVEGSGWGILVREPWSGHLAVLGAEKHENFTVWGAIPLLVIDVWEHAYYLKYKNMRTSYVDAIFNVIDWEAVGLRYAWVGKLV
ncbi:MAG: superoxide dismutase [Planctomycetes bacterium]|nr:superoxide dismutase [Planctomycetota bacterium]